MGHPDATPARYGIAPAGYRLPHGTRVGGVRLQVADLQRSIDYYETVIGLRATERTLDTAALGVPGDDRVLVWLQGRHGLQPVPRGGAFGLFHFAVLLPERAALGRFAAHLSRLGVAVGMADHLVSEALYLRDPDGLGIEVYADRPKDAWRYTGRELRMTTDPLDVGNLVAAGGQGSWEGAPTGTTMGHVHLHVGNLDLAEAFYHSTLGFDKTVWSYPGALFFAAGWYHHHLGTNTWSPGPSADEGQARLLEWELLVPGAQAVAAAAQSLEAGGYPTHDTGVGWIVADPWGTRLRIIAD